MNDDQIRISIAEKCGWLFKSRAVGQLTVWDGYRPDGSYAISDEYKRYDILPDYPNDLNAMAEAENSLNDTDWEEYYRQLHIVTRPAVFQPRPGCDEHAKAFIHATARQRAEAFLRVFGLWREGGAS